MRITPTPAFSGFWGLCRRSVLLLAVGLSAAAAESDGGGTDKCEHGGAGALPLPADGSDLVGAIRYVRALSTDSLHDIACRYNIGIEEIFMANDPFQIDHWLPGEGTRVMVPQQFILPDAPRAGVVVNIPEMRLYFFPVRYAPVVRKAPSVPKKKSTAKGTKAVPPPRPALASEVGEPIDKATEVISYPISMGRMDWRTPPGKTRIAAKVKDPTWTPPESIRREHAAKGDMLPAVVPAGPDNPLGAFAMRLGVPGYLIHGTEQNYKSFGIGMRVTHGCMRMYNQDVARLFPMVAVGTPVYLVNQPVKLGWQGGRLFMELSEPLDEDAGIPPEKDEESMTQAELAREAAKTPEQVEAEKKWKKEKRSAYLFKVAIKLIEKENARRPLLLDREAMENALATLSGIPVDIGKEAPPPLQEAAPDQSLPAEPNASGASSRPPEPQDLLGTYDIAPTPANSEPEPVNQGLQTAEPHGSETATPPPAGEEDRSLPDPYAPDQSMPADADTPESEPYYRSERGR